MKLLKYFDAFLSSTVNLNDTRIASLDARVEAVTNYLRNHSTFQGLFIDVFPQGSYAQRTIIKPVGNHEYDADVLLVLKSHTTWTPAEYIAELKTALASSPNYAAKVHSRTRCVYIDYADDFHLDLVPFIESLSAITNKKTNEFERTYPENFTSWLEAKNRITDGRLPATIRLLKYLRDSKQTFSIKSVVLTTLVGSVVDASKLLADDAYYSDTPTVLTHILMDLDDYLQSHPGMPVISDPGGTGEDFSERWDQKEYANFRSKIHDYAGKAARALTLPDVEESVAAWQELFGTKFTKPPSTSVIKAHATANEPEEFLPSDHDIAIRRTESVRLVGRVRGSGVRRAYDLPTRGDRVGKGRTIDFHVTECTVREPYEVWWKVRNSGREAIEAGQLRGTIQKHAESRYEVTKFAGTHFVEVYIIKNGVCCATDKQQVIVTR